jgi:pyruvate formate lyase activating enzyme
MTGIVFDIRRFTVHDGPGIRTTVFLKGCPLNCWWCHNPESIPLGIDQVETTQQLDGKSYCTTQTIGREISVDDLLLELRKDLIFYEESGGGITFSGGEPLLQSAFVAATAKELQQQGIHVAIDTCGAVHSEQFQRVMPYTNLFLFDLKHLDSKEHARYTGMGNERVLQNLEQLFDHNKQVIIRIPVIPEINDTENNIALFQAYLSAHAQQISEVHLLPFHNMASGKYLKFNRPNLMGNVPSLTAAQLQPLKAKFEVLGLTVKIGG